MVFHFNYYLVPQSCQWFIIIIACLTEVLLGYFQIENGQGFGANAQRYFAAKMVASSYVNSTLLKLVNWGIGVHCHWKCSKCLRATQQLLLSRCKGEDDYPFFPHSWEEGLACCQELLCPYLDIIKIDWLQTLSNKLHIQNCQQRWVLAFRLQHQRHLPGTRSLEIIYFTIKCSVASVSILLDLHFAFAFRIFLVHLRFCIFVFVSSFVILFIHQDAQSRPEASPLGVRAEHSASHTSDFLFFVNWSTSW